MALFGSFLTPILLITVPWLMDSASPFVLSLSLYKIQQTHGIHSQMAVRMILAINGLIRHTLYLEYTYVHRAFIYLLF